MATIHKSDGGLVHQHYQKALELEKHLLTSIQSKGTFDPNVRSLRNKLRELYESIILEDHEFAESHEVEQLLWRLHHTRIDDFRARIRKSTVATGLGKAGAVGRRESVQKILAVFRSFLAEATGFYHDLMLKIRAKHGLPQDDSSNCAIEAFGVKNDESRLAEIWCQMSCHRCMIYLGDLARYKEYYSESDGANHDWSIAAGFYAKAISLSPASGNPHNQLAVLATYVGDELLAVYRYFRSLFVEFPFLTAKDNLIVLFEKNRNSYLQLAASLCDNFTYPSKVGIGESSIDASTKKGKSKGNKWMGSGKGHAKSMQNESDESLELTTVVALCPIEVLKNLQVCFVRLNGILFTRTSLETFIKVQSHVHSNLKQLMKLHAKGDTDRSSNILTAGGLWGSGPSIILQLVSILICSVHNANRNLESNQPSYAEIVQRSVILEHTFMTLFDCMDCIVEHCVDADAAAVSPYLPSVLIVMEWLSCRPEMALGTEVKEKEKNSRMLFWRTCAKLLNRLWKYEARSDARDVAGVVLVSMPFKGSNVALSEDCELQGFMPLQPIHAALDFTIKPTVGIGGRKEMQARIHRIVRAGKILSSTFEGMESGIHVDPETSTFYHGGDKKGVGDSKAVLEELNGSLKATPLPEETEEQHVKMQVKSIEECSLPKIFSGDEDDEVIVFRPSVAKLKVIERENNKAIVGRTPQEFRKEQTLPFQLQPLNSMIDSQSNIDVAMNTSTLSGNMENRLCLPDGMSTTSLVSSSLPVLLPLHMQINSFRPALPGNHTVVHADLDSYKSEDVASAVSAHDMGSLHSTLPSNFDPLMNSEIGLRVFNDNEIMLSGSAIGWANSGTSGSHQNLTVPPVGGTSFIWPDGTQFGMFQNQQPWVSKLSWQVQTGDSFWSPELQNLNPVAKSKVIRSSNAVADGAGNGVCVTDIVQSFAPKLPHKSSDLLPERILEAANMLPNSLLDDLQVCAFPNVHDIESSLADSNAASETFKAVPNEATETKESLLNTSSITSGKYGFGMSLDGKKPGWKPAGVAGMRPPPGFSPLSGLKASEAPPVSTDLLAAGTSGFSNASSDGFFQPMIYDDYSWLDGYTPSGASQQTAVCGKPGSRIYRSVESDITASPFPGMKFPDHTRSLSPAAGVMQQQNSMADLQQELAMLHLERQLQQAQQHASAPFLAQIDQRLPDPSWSLSPLQAMASQQQQLHHPLWPPTDLFMS